MSCRSRPGPTGSPSAARRPRSARAARCPGRARAPGRRTPPGWSAACGRPAAPPGPGADPPGSRRGPCRGHRSRSAAVAPGCQTGHPSARPPGGSMRYAVNVPNFAEYADVRAAAALAAEAEAAGWDGFFVWDHIVFAKEQRLPVADPWILLAAVALATERLRLGPMVTALARRRPWKVAREAVTLDHLSYGRLILGVGLGVGKDLDITAFGEEANDAARAKMLYEALNILRGLWSGLLFSYHGTYYHVNEVTFLPMPYQKPRIP